MIINLNLLPTMESHINILSLNVGLSSTLAGLSALTSVNRPDLILLQEVRISKEQLKNIIGAFG